MLCYKDMTFCSKGSVCETKECPRNLSSYEIKAAQAQGFPIAWSDFSTKCNFYWPTIKPDTFMPTILFCWRWWLGDNNKEVGNKVFFEDCWWHGH
jgi:hypothetical protein